MQQFEMFPDEIRIERVADLHHVIKSLPDSV